MSSRLIAYLLFFIAVCAQTQASTCGARPNTIERLLFDTDKIYLQCEAEAREKKRQEVMDLVTELNKELKAQAAKLKQSADLFNESLNRIRCQNPQQDRDPALVKQCQEDLALYNALLTQIDHLMGWSASVAHIDATPKDTPKKESIDVDCPDETTMKKIKPVRYFKKDLYKVYERCVIGKI